MNRDRAYLERILKARVYDVAIETPLEPAPRLSARLGNTLLLKREDLQPIFSFKLRGAYNKMVRLSAAQRRRGVIASSAGNHAQGVALAARRLGCRAIIVMPVITPEIKVEAVRALGGEVVLHGDSYDEAAARARTLARSRGLTMVHPYDDPEVIAGQGTIGMEILRQHPDSLHAVFVPVGGGGLIAGIAVYLKSLCPSTRIVGVEPADAASLHAALVAGRRVKLKEAGAFADGAAVRQVGREPFRLCRKFVDEVVLVNTDAICAAIKDVFEDTRTILEPAGALGVAGAKAYVERTRIRKEILVAVACGANMNFDRLRHVAERAELGEGREAILAVTIPERPGSFKAFCAELGPLSISEFNYRYGDPREAVVFVGVHLQKRRDAASLLRRLRRRGFRTEDLSDNELAKLHVRHMVGGRVPGLKHERILRFEFPERPGALTRFLNRMPHTWNITLFHYRNHGTDYGRVLAGIQVPPRDRALFLKFLKKLGYTWKEETDNPAYRIFLG